MKRYFPVVSIMLLFSISCIGGISKNEVMQNGKIDQKLRTEMNDLNKQAYRYMAENNFEFLSQLFTDTLTARLNPEFSTKFLPQIQKVLKGGNFKIFDEFYIRNVKPKDTVALDAGIGENAYTMKFITFEKETYVSLLLAGDSTNKVMLSFIWIKTNGKWKMSNLTGEDYSLNNRSAIEQYKYARSLQQENDLIDAVNIMSLADHCIAPGGGYFRYKSITQIAGYSDSLTNMTKARYPFPYTAKEMNSKPLIFNVHLEIYENKFIPMVMYISNINVADTVDLKIENQEMQQKIGIIFSGMAKNNPYLLYRAYNEQPDGRNNPRYYGYIQKTD